MKIFIQGRKGGYSVLYPFPTPDEFYSFAKDIQSINAQNQAQYYGKSLYSIAFSRGGRIFSKYVLGYDLQRFNLGNISFSIFIPDGKTMSGGNVIDVLDELSSTYFKTYAPNYYISECQENWNLFTEIASRYDAKLATVDNLDIQHMERGQQNAAFVYYSSKEKLANLFEDAYQNVYSQYLQIFLIDGIYTGETYNPLTAFQYTQSANLTNSVDLENKRYRFSRNSDSFAKVFRNGDTYHIQADEHFYKKDKLVIKWARKFYKPQRVEGFLDELQQYLDIDETRRTVSIKPIKLDIETKDIQAQFLLRGSPVTDLTVQYRNNQGCSKLMENGVLHFEGEEIYQDWALSIFDQHLISQEESIRPELSKELLVIRLREKKKISVRVIDENSKKPIESAKIYCRGNNQWQTWAGKSNIFYDEQLDEQYKLEVSAPGYVRNENYSFSPRELEGDEILIELIKEQHKDRSTAPLTYEGWANSGEEQRSEHECRYGNESRDDSQFKQRPGRGHGWIQRNWRTLVLGILLLCSLIANVVLGLDIITVRNQYSVVNEAKEYLQKGELLQSKLSDINVSKKIDTALYNAVEEIRVCRRDIDNGHLNYDSWNFSYGMCYNNEIERLKTICDKNPSSRNKMERKLKDLDNIASKPLKEIVDSIEAVAANPDNYYQPVEDEPVKPEEFGEMKSYDESPQSSTAVDMPSRETEKEGLIRKILSRRK